MLDDVKQKDRQQILAYGPGRALDIRVAVEIMGWQFFPYLLPGWPSESGTDPGTIYLCPPGVRVHISNVQEPPAYSFDATATRLVIAEIVKWDKESLFRFSQMLESLFSQVLQGTSLISVVRFSLATCKAALLAVLEMRPPATPWLAPPGFYSWPGGSAAPKDDGSPQKPASRLAVQFEDQDRAIILFALRFLRSNLDDLTDEIADSDLFSSLGPAGGLVTAEDIGRVQTRIGEPSPI